MSQAQRKTVDYRNQIKVVGFDLDQTLYPKSSAIDDAIQTYLYEKISNHLAITRQEAKIQFKKLYHEEGYSGSQSLIRLGLPGAKDMIQEALEKANIADFLKPDPRTIKLLREIAQSYGNMDIITGSNKHNTEQKLKHMTISQDYFKHIITASDGPKSDGSTYSLWLSLYPHYSPEQFLYIGDRAASDYYIPKALDINTILVYVDQKDSDIDCPQLDLLHDIASILL